MRDTLVPETNIERDQLPKPAETWATGDLRPNIRMFTPPQQRPHE
jgi:hypothetical protein